MASFASSNNKYFFFYGNTEKSGDKRCLSNWSPHDFVDDNDIRYLTMEHYMMFHKAKLFKDSVKMEEILLADTPKKAKELGRKVKNFDDKTWFENARSIVTKGLFFKFSQHEEIKQFLLATEDKILVETSPYDKIWGIGLAEPVAKRTPPENWPGTNYLGQCLMEVRQILRNP